MEPGTYSEQLTLKDVPPHLLSKKPFMPITTINLDIGYGDFAKFLFMLR